MAKDENCCRKCAWHDGFSWVCCNGRSDFCADFTDDDFWCRQFASVEDTEKELRGEKNNG